MDVLLLIPCLCDALQARAGEATVRVMERFGCRVRFPEAQTCCGQPWHNSGMPREARALARRAVRVFGGELPVVTPSGSCAAMIREHYAGLFTDPADAAAAAGLAARTYELSEFLSGVLKVDLREAGASWPGRIAWHDSCHSRALGTPRASRHLLSMIAGLELAPFDHSDQCCGFGGLFAANYPDISASLGRAKLACVAAAGAGCLASGEPGCSLHLRGLAHRAGVPTRFVSLAEIIAESLGLMECPSIHGAVS